MRGCIFRLGIILLLGLLFSYGCSSGGDITVPPPGKTNTAYDSHFLWGMWQFTADPESETIDVMRLRECDMHVNVIVFLEPPPLLHLTLESLEFNGNIIEADIGLRHPFLGLNEFTGFDVCGILITNGSITGFQDSDIVIAGDGDKIVGFNVLGQHFAPGISTPLRSPRSPLWCLPSMKRLE